MTPLNEHDGETPGNPIILDTCGWPRSARVSVALRAADEAVREGGVSVMNAGILTMAIGDGLCATEISDRPGISTNSVYQQLQRVKRELPVFVSKQELFE